MIHLKKPRTSLGIKIFGLATLMLLLLFIIAYHAYHRLGSVRDDIIDLTEYLIPITNMMNDIDIHVLDQGLHLERWLRLLQRDPGQQEGLTQARQVFDTQSRNVQEGLRRAKVLSSTAVKQATDPQDQAILARLLPRLAQLEQEYQELNAHALTMVAHLVAQPRADTQVLDKQLHQEMDDYYREMEVLRQELQQFTQRAARTTRRHQQAVLRLNLLMTGVATVVAVGLAWYLTRRMVLPIHDLRRAMAAVGAGNLDTQVHTLSQDEIGQLADAFRDLVHELGVKERIKTTFGKYVDPRVVTDLLEPSRGPELGGEKRVMTVVFADISGFAAATETLPPDDFVAVLNQYLSIVSEPVSAAHGVIDKFMDTTVMAFWGPPFTREEEHATLACEAILGQLACVDAIQDLVRQHTGTTRLAGPPLDLQVGLATGPLVVGNMGSDQSKSYTVLGDTVNVASRLHGAAKQYGVRALMTSDTYDMVHDTMVARELDLIQVIGKEEPVRIYELLGRQAHLSQDTIQWKNIFAQGLRAYRKQDWHTATAHFQDCLRVKADDTPARIYIDRIEELRTNPPGADWNAVWKLTEK